jgi:adenylate cyclase class 2
MNIEYEASFPEVDKDEVQGRLRAVGATLVRLEFLQRRVVFRLPSGHEIDGAWARVRDEGDKITMSLKIVDGDRIEDQKEICLTVDSFDQAELMLMTLGCARKSYQETKRELWTLDGVEVTIDEWPFIDPFVEVEGRSEEEVRKVSEKIGFDYSKALFGAVDIMCMRKYPHLTADRINNHTPRIVFGEENPFLMK